VNVAVAVGEGVKVYVGEAVGVAVWKLGINAGMLHVNADATSSNMTGRNLFMERTIHARQGGVKEGCSWQNLEGIGYI
jgi:hypothetical protein